ncbi:MAG: gliding motility-associated C-terminal domain-containing protein, partial [Bacteroidota bacterium]
DYQWFDNSTELTYLIEEPGIIWLEASNPCGSSRDSMVVVYDSLPRFELGPDLELCDQETVRLDASFPGATYEWQDLSVESAFLVTSAGTYFATSTNQCGIWSDTVTAVYDSIPQIDLGDDQILCEGEVVTLDATWPSAQITWNDNNTEPIRDLTLSGTYSVTASNRCGVDSSSVTLEFLPLPQVEFGSPDTVLCGGGPLFLDVTQADATYNWHDGGTQSTFTVNTEGQYYVTVTRANCTASDTINVRIGIVPTVEIGDRDLLCDEETLSLDVSIPDSAAIYRWTDGLDVASREISQSGNYGITITNECGTATDNLFVETAKTPVVDLGSDGSFCEGEFRTLDATFDQATYRWQDGSSNPIFTVDTSGLYSVFVRTACGSASDEVILNQVSLPVFDLGPDTTICQERELRLKVPGNLGDIRWENGSTSPNFLVEEAGVYAVSIANACGFFRDEILVGTVQCECELFVPTAFTPDGDNYNDEFKVFQECGNLQGFQLKIFNRWGHLIFSSDDPQATWDGTTNGRPVAVGVYAWVAEYVYLGGEGNRRDVQRGTVTLLR